MTFWENLLRAILETCDLWDICSEWWEDMTWPKRNDKDKYENKDNDKDKDKHLLRAILETCDIGDTDYNSDNWEPEFMTIFVTWQLIVTLDSICNSCDVSNTNWPLSAKWSDTPSSYAYCILCTMRCNWQEKVGQTLNSMESLCITAFCNILDQPVAMLLRALTALQGA